MSSAVDEVDPVCGRQVDRHEAAATIRHQDFTYFFDTAECAEAFRRDPARYTTGAGYGLGLNTISSRIARTITSKT